MTMAKFNKECGLVVGGGVEMSVDLISMKLVM